MTSESTAAEPRNEVVPAARSATTSNAIEQHASGNASKQATLVAFSLIGLGGVVATVLWRLNISPAPIRPDGPGMVLLLLFVFAAAVERVLEALSRWFPVASSEQPDEATTGLTGRADRAVVAWGAGCALASISCSGFGFYLLHAIAGPNWNGVAIWIDAIVTGVMIGGGTKPLHDAIMRMQAARDRLGM